MQTSPEDHDEYAIWDTPPAKRTPNWGVIDGVILGGGLLMALYVLYIAFRALTAFIGEVQ